MGLRHQPLEVVDEPFAAVFRILIVPPDVDRLFRAHLLAIAAENAAELVDLEDEWIAVAVLVLTWNELDAIRRAYRWAQTAGDAFGFAVFGREHTVRAPPPRRERPFLFRVL